MPPPLRIGALLLSLALAACGGSALGYEQPPIPVDPASPRIGALDIAFDRSELRAPAGAPFILVFENREAPSHNVSIYADAAFQHRLFEGAIFAGPATRWYPVPALAAGTYRFRCDVHPSMTGRLVTS
jgi:plastocyanin